MIVLFIFNKQQLLQAVKKLLCENLQEEEIDQQKNLYKTLWLEAEASLCVMTAKARFMRMKNDMKRTHDEVKGKVHLESIVLACLVNQFYCCSYMITE